MAKHRNPRKKSSLARRKKGKKSQWSMRSLDGSGTIVEVEMPFTKKS